MVAVLTSHVMHMLQFSAPKPTVWMGCRGGANVIMWWPQPTDGRGVARICEEINHRWPWFMCQQVDRPFGEEQSRPMHNSPSSRGQPRKSREASGIQKRQVPMDGETSVTSPLISSWYLPGSEKIGGVTVSCSCLTGTYHLVWEKGSWYCVASKLSM